MNWRTVANFVFSWTDLNARCYELRNLLSHQVVKMWVETVHWTVNTHSHIILSHLVNERGHTSWYQMCSTSRHTLTYVTHIATVLVSCMVQAQFLQHLPAVPIASPFITVKIIQFPANNINMQICEVGATLAPFNIVSWYFMVIMPK